MREHLSLWILLGSVSYVYPDDNFALLQGTLKTFQKSSCDDQHIGLHCPAGTCISVLVAQYGTSTEALHSLCPDFRQAKPNISCIWPSPIQYSLLQTVMEACHKKRQCKFHVNPNSFTGDPCPGYRKYIEVAYKCRPYEFRSKMACQDETLQLACANPQSRVAVYSASFGRTEYESVQCPQPQGVREETCLANYATETVMRICHGKHQCSVTADAPTFGTPCNRLSKTYLKVVYTCVPRTVLQDQSNDPTDLTDERTDQVYDLEYEGSVDNALRENQVSPKMAVAGGRHNSSEHPSHPESEKPLYPPSNLDEEFEDTRNQLILGLLLAIGGGLVLLAALLGVRYCWGRRQGGATAGTVDKELTKGYSEDVSEDIDLTSPTAVIVLPSPKHGLPQEVIRYKEETPLSLAVTASSDYYYG